MRGKEQRKKDNENKDRKEIIFAGVKNLACVIKSLNCCLAVSHIDDELTTFCLDYPCRFGETSRTDQKI